MTPKVLSVDFVYQRQGVRPVEWEVWNPKPTLQYGSGSLKPPASWTGRFWQTDCRLAPENGLVDADYAFV